MGDRFVFRQVYTPDIELFARDGEVRAKNHANAQACHQTSYAELVDRRGTAEFQMPCGGVVNDYVPFYFSPFTAFCYTIYKGNVQLRNPDGAILGRATQDERSFLVFKAATLINHEGLETYFSNTALNNKTIDIEFGTSMGQLETVVKWSLFDDPPMSGMIPEVGYKGCCPYFLSKADPERYQDRSPRRMAEFLVKSAVPLNLAECVLTPSAEKKAQVEAVLAAYGINLPVHFKSGCFF